MAKKDISAQAEKEKIQARAKKDAEIKEQHKAALKETDEVDGKEYVAYFKIPNRAFIGAAMGVIDTDPLRATEILFDGCVIREVSDVDHFRNNDGLMLNLVYKLQRLIPLKKSQSTTL